MTGKSALETLYPFLHGKEQDPAALDAGLLHSIEEKARESRETNARFFAEQAGVLLDAAKALAATGASHIYLAGKPGENAKAWEEAGIGTFVYQGCDTLDLLQDAYERLGA